MYKCSKCNKEFLTQKSLSGHQSKHGKKTYIKCKCEKCQKEFSNKQVLSRHINLSCGTEIKFGKFYCKYCNKEFNRDISRISHTGGCKLNPNYEQRKINCSIANSKRKHSQETKDKISKSRISYLLKNPDKVPYRLNHSSKRSYPEIVFENALTESGITGWTTQYQNSIYQYDFAFPELKIDVEIDGGTHSSEKVKKIDKRRDEFSIENGWKVIRFSAKEIKNNVIKCVNELNEILN